MRETALERAIEQDDAVTVEALLSRSEAGVLTDTSTGMPPLVRAAQHDAHRALRVLLAAGAPLELSERDMPRRRALHCAAEAGSLRVLADLVAAGADLNAVDADGGTALAAAAGFGNVAGVEALLARGANPNTLDTEGFSPLARAASDRRAGIFCCLLDAGADPNLYTTHQASPLWCAAASGLRDGVERLIGAGARLEGTRVVFAAATWLALPRLERILSLGVGLGERDESGNTPLHYAARARNPERRVGVLLRHGADPMARNRFGWTPLHRLASRKRGPGVVSAMRVLMEHGAELDAVDGAGITVTEVLERAGRKVDADELRSVQNGRRLRDHLPKRPPAAPDGPGL